MKLLESNYKWIYLRKWFYFVKTNYINIFFRTKSTVHDFYDKIARCEYWIISWNQSTISFTLLKSSFHGNFAKKLNICAQCGNCRHSLSHFFSLKFRESNGFINKLLNSWFDEIFFSDREFHVFPHCGKVDKNTIINFTEKFNIFPSNHLFF